MCAHRCIDTHRCARLTWVGQLRGMKEHGRLVSVASNVAMVTAAAAHPTAGVTVQMLVMLSKIFSTYPLQGLDMRCSVSSKTPPRLRCCL